jgi:hypothetical protein
MKKIILTMAVVLTASFANAQSNQKGTIHVNVMGGFLSGSATNKLDGDPDTDKYSATGAQFGANFQYGIADSFSAGIGLEFGTTVLTSNNYFDIYDENYDPDLDSYSPSVSTFKIILSGRYYFLNKDKFNLFASPSIGYTSGKDTTSAIIGNSDSTKYSGLNYGINAGGNYYFTDRVGVILNLGYEGNSLKSTTSGYGVDLTGNSTLGAIKVMAGLALKF